MAIASGSFSAILGGLFIFELSADHESGDDDPEREAENPERAVQLFRAGTLDHHDITIFKRREGRALRLDEALEVVLEGGETVFCPALDMDFREIGIAFGPARERDHVHQVRRIRHRVDTLALHSTEHIYFDEQAILWVGILKLRRSAPDFLEPADTVERIDSVSIEYEGETEDAREKCNAGTEFAHRKIVDNIGRGAKSSFPLREFTRQRSFLKCARKVKIKSAARPMKGRERVAMEGLTVELI